MKKEILYELADKWERGALFPHDVSKDAGIPNAVTDGIRTGIIKGKRECADSLRALIELIG